MDRDSVGLILTGHHATAGVSNCADPRVVLNFNAGTCNGPRCGTVPSKPTLQGPSSIERKGAAVAGS